MRINLNMADFYSEESGTIDVRVNGNQCKVIFRAKKPSTSMPSVMSINFNKKDMTRTKNILMELVKTMDYLEKEEK